MYRAMSADPNRVIQASECEEGKVILRTPTPPSLLPASGSHPCPYNWKELFRQFSIPEENLGNLETLPQGKENQIQARERDPGKAEQFIPSHTPRHGDQKTQEGVPALQSALRVSTNLCCLSFSRRRWARRPHCAFSDTFGGQLEGGWLWQERGILRARIDFSLEISLMCPQCPEQRGIQRQTQPHLAIITSGNSLWDHHRVWITFAGCLPLPQKSGIIVFIWGEKTQAREAKKRLRNTIHKETKTLPKVSLSPENIWRPSPCWLTRWTSEV